MGRTSGSEPQPGADVEALFQRLWRDYVAITPQAKRIHALLEARGERFRNDHVAFRTYDLAPIGLEALEAPFLALGYEASGEYEFEEKRLYARGYLHPSGTHPRVFLSELLTERFDGGTRRLLEGIASQVPTDLRAEDLVHGLRPWSPVSVDLYEALLDVSEYAAWVAAFGIRANHFTVHANDLTTFSGIAELNAFLEGEGFALNGSGSKIQGGPEVLLEQSSTLADRVRWEFADGVSREIPSCYYEFARRYPEPATGELFQGFVAKSADSIFESTDARRS